MKAKDPLAIFACLPPSESAIGKYTLASFGSSERPIHFFGSQSNFENWKICKEKTGESGVHRLFHWSCFDEAYQSFSYSDCLFVLGNSHHHIDVLRGLIRWSQRFLIRSHIHIHEAQLSNVWLSFFEDQVDVLLNVYRTFYPEKEKELVDFKSIGRSEIYGLRLLSALARPKTIITNSTFCRQIVEKELSVLVEKPEFAQAFLPVQGGSEPIEKPALFSKPDELLNRQGRRLLRVGSFGIPHPVKHIDILVQACEILNNDGFPLELVLAGPGVTGFLKENRLGGSSRRFIRAIDNPTDAEMAAVMESIDVGVQLRWPSHGESSACVNELLALGKRVVVTEIGSFSDLKEFALLTPVGVSPNELAKVLRASKDFIPQPREYLSQFSVERFQMRMTSIFESLL